MCAEETHIDEEELIREYKEHFYLAATIQGRLAYLFMSIHAVNPSICARFTDYNPGPILFYNMVYGMAVHLYIRPHMQLMGDIHRVVFSTLGSLMFNHCTMMVYEWLINLFPERPYTLTFMGFFTGRILLLYFLAYLYHVDRRSVI